MQLFLSPHRESRRIAHQAPELLHRSPFGPPSRSSGAVGETPLCRGFVAGLPADPNQGHSVTSSSSRRQARTLKRLFDPPEGEKKPREADDDKCGARVALCGKCGRGVGTTSLLGREAPSLEVVSLSAERLELTNFCRIADIHSYPRSAVCRKTTSCCLGPASLSTPAFLPRSP
ncbi:hypothetical protein E2C01_041713 [Portunus trituberculatus]|uniref:Uncharacterized protein n=1 Tax=Portunus trituberculatus TaxID=210409 RepID=A0A5B7FNA2_PORTR|nr:hypothetical protein [Portunus trituberculatus]